MSISSNNKPLLRELKEMGVLNSTPAIVSDNFDQTPTQTLAKFKQEIFNGDGTGVKYALDSPYAASFVSCLAFPHDGTAGGRNIKFLAYNTDWKYTDGSNFKNILNNGAYRILLTYISN